jgi:hypothetical protein
MLPSTFPALAIILLAIVPGYVATSFWARTRTWKGRTTDLLTVLQSISVSVVIVGIMSFPAYWWFYADRDHLDLHPVRVVVWVLLTAYVVPMLGGILFGYLFDQLTEPTSMTFTGTIRRFLAPFLPAVIPPTIWDWAFTSGVPDNSFIIVEYTDKTRVAGVFEAGSIAYTSPEPPGLYLRREWTVDENGDFLAEVPNTNGVIIVNTANVRSIRILS